MDAKEKLFADEMAVSNQAETIRAMRRDGDRRVAAYHAKLWFRKAQVEYVAELARRKVEAAAARVAADAEAYRKAHDLKVMPWAERRRLGRATDIAR